MKIKFETWSTRISTGTNIISDFLMIYPSVLSTAQSDCLLMTAYYIDQYKPSMTHYDYRKISIPYTLGPPPGWWTLMYQCATLWIYVPQSRTNFISTQKYLDNRPLAIVDHCKYLGVYSSAIRSKLGKVYWRESR